MNGRRLGRILGMLAGLTVGVAWIAAPAPAIEPVIYRDADGYGFYDVWWREARSDVETALLLHAGRPSEHPWTRPGNRKLQAEAEADGGELAMMFDELEAGPGPGSPGMGSMMDELSGAKLKGLEEAAGRSRDEAAPPGVVYDYSPGKLTIKLPRGVEKVEGGKFGQALRFTGRTGLSVTLVNDKPKEVIDGWFKPAELPDEPMVLWATKSAALRLMPDGRVTLAWEGDDGEPRQLQSDKPIQPGQWTHIAAHYYVLQHIELYKVMKRPELEYRKADFYLTINGRAVDRLSFRDAARPKDWMGKETLYIGMTPDGGSVYTGLIDDFRVASLRRYVERKPLPELADDRPIPFGPPHFKRDDRVFHVSFESQDMVVSQGAPKWTWDLGDQIRLADMQIKGPRGKAIVVDPALGFPRIPIQGMSNEQGSLELWLRPHNWDNYTNYGKINWSEHMMSVIRLMGRHKRTGEIVPFMELELPRASIHGTPIWTDPGQWMHLVWTWSPQDVFEEDGWGKIRKGDPLTGFRARFNGELFWRGHLKRDNSLLGKVEPLYMEIGIPEPIKVYQGQRPAIAIDEVIGYSRPLTEQEVLNAPKRWSGELE